MEVGSSLPPLVNHGKGPDEEEHRRTIKVFDWSKYALERRRSSLESVPAASGVKKDVIPLLVKRAKLMRKANNGNVMAESYLSKDSVLWGDYEFLPPPPPKTMDIEKVLRCVNMESLVSMEQDFTPLGWSEGRLRPLQDYPSKKLKIVEFVKSFYKQGLASKDECDFSCFQDFQFAMICGLIDFFYEISEFGRFSDTSYQKILDFLVECPSVSLFDGFHFGTKLASSIFTGSVQPLFQKTPKFTDQSMHTGKIKKLYWWAQLDAIVSAEDKNDGLLFWNPKAHYMDFSRSLKSHLSSEDEKVSNLLSVEVASVFSAALDGINKTVCVLYSNKRVSFFQFSFSPKGLQFTQRASQKFEMQFQDVWRVHTLKSWAFSDTSGGVHLVSTPPFSLDYLTLLPVDRVLKGHRSKVTALLEVVGCLTDKEGVPSTPVDRMTSICPFFVTSSLDRTFCIWDMRTMGTDSQIRDHKAAVLGLAYVPPPHGLLISVGCERTVYVWNFDFVSFRGSRAKLGEHQFNLLSVAAGPHLFSTLDEGGNIKIWDARVVACTQNLQLDGSVPLSSLILLPPYGAMYASGNRFYNFTGNQEARVCLESSKLQEGGEGGVSQEEMKGEALIGRRFVWGGIHSTSGLAVIATEAEVFLVSRREIEKYSIYKAPPTDPLVSCRIFEKDHVLCVFHSKGSIRFLRLRTGFPMQVFRGRDQLIGQDCLTEGFHPVALLQRQKKASGLGAPDLSFSGLERSFKKQDSLAAKGPSPPDIARGLASGISSSCLDGDRRLFVGSSDGRILIFELPSMKCGEWIVPPSVEPSPATCLQYLTEEEILICGYQNGKVNFYSTHPLRLLYTQPLNPATQASQGEIASLTAVNLGGGVEGGGKIVMMCFQEQGKLSFWEVILSRRGAIDSVLEILSHEQLTRPILGAEGVATDPSMRYSIVKSFHFPEVDSLAGLEGEASKYIYVFDSDGRVSCVDISKSCVDLPSLDLQATREKMLRDQKRNTFNFQSYTSVEVLDPNLPPLTVPLAWQAHDAPIVSAEKVLEPPSIVTTDGLTVKVFSSSGTLYAQISGDAAPPPLRISQRWPPPHCVKISSWLEEEGREIAKLLGHGSRPSQRTFEEEEEGGKNARRRSQGAQNTLSQNFKKNESESEPQSEPESSGEEGEEESEEEEVEEEKVKTSLRMSKMLKANAFSQGFFSLESYESSLSSLPLIQKYHRKAPNTAYNLESLVTDFESSKKYFLAQKLPKDFGISVAGVERKRWRKAVREAKLPPLAASSSRKSVLLEYSNLTTQEIRKQAEKVGKIENVRTDKKLKKLKKKNKK